MFRGFVFLGSLLFSAGTIWAQSAPPPAVAYPASRTPVSVSGKQTLLLWPNGAPGAQGDADEDKPALTVFLPANNPTHTGIVIAPGGGYTHLAFEKEGTAVAQWLNDHGVAAFVLKYRLGPKYHHPAELQDALRAIRTVRSHAGEWHLDKDKVGMLGFSAGGHLTASAGLLHSAPDVALDTQDAIDKLSGRPDFMVLCYPVISLEPPYAHMGSRTALLGTDPDPALTEEMSLLSSVNAHAPKTFLFSTTDDQTVPIQNTLQMYEALIAARVDAEMHIFEHGKHGVGLAQSDVVLREWPNLLLHWLQANGWAAK